MNGTNGSRPSRAPTGRGHSQAPEKDEELLGASEVGVQLATLYAEADALAVALAERLGDRRRGDTPNLASLMLLVEENGKTLLLTGNGLAGHPRGLEATGKLAPGGDLFVDVLKVQHHGAEYNWAREFGRRIIARDYIFCGNGSMKTPNRVVQAVLDSRRRREFKSKHPKPSDVQALVQLVRGGRESEVQRAHERT